MALFPAFLDTCVLFSSYLCDTLLRQAEAQVFRPLWSAGVMAELERTLAGAGIPDDAIRHRISEMRRSFPDAEVRGYEPLIDAMQCNAKDRHVLAAAVRGQAQVLVTADRELLATPAVQYDITMVHPDDFLLDQLDLYPGPVMSVLREQSADYTEPPVTVSELLGRLARTGVPNFAAEARRHL